MNPKSIKKLFSSLIILVGASNAFAGSSLSVERAEICFESYFKALQQGSTEEAKQFWNKEEIKKYRIFDWQWGVLTFQGLNPAFINYKITNAEEKNNYVVLQVEWFYREGKAGPIQKDTRYFIEEDGRVVGANPIFIHTRGWLQKESKHFVYHFKNKEEKPTTVLLERMDRFYEKTIEFMQVDFKDKIDYYKCNSTEEVGSLFVMQPSLARSQVINRMVASIQGFVPHEIVHVISYRMLPPEESGIPPMILDEGLSYYLGGASFFSTELLMSWAKKKLERDENTLLVTLLVNPWAYGSNESAGLEASFVKFLIETRGRAKFKELYTDSRFPEEQAQVLDEIYGKSIQQLQKEWKEYILALDLPEVKTDSSNGAQEIFHMADSVGDDKGDGDYAYPENQKAKPGMFDLKDFKVSWDKGWVYFELQFADLSHSEITSDTSFNGTFAAIAIDTDHKKNSGNTQLFFGNGNSEFSEMDAYEFVIEVSNAGVLVYDKNWVWQVLFLKAESQKDHIDGNEFSFAIPQKIIGIPDASWKIQVLTGGQTGGYKNTAFGVGIFMKVGKILTPDQGGGGVDPHFNPDIYDILTTKGMNQTQILSEYNAGKKKKTTIPMFGMK